ncbi:MAG: hypothetical protein GX657_06710 [Chloroflexi bacterium]|jgi:Na+/H+ antiporter NhaA|nr:hypothetical protein [Chloroflexota bacterium]
MRTQARIAVGAVLSVAGALGAYLSLTLGWGEAPRPWSFLLGFAVGVLCGLGATLAVAGLLERRRRQ